MKDGALKTVSVGLLAGFLSNGVLGALFFSPPIQTILYNPSWQSRLFIEVTPKRNVALSVGGLVVLSVIHAWLFSVLKTAVPGSSWPSKGLFWGFTIWLIYWLSQEWFIYHTLLGEPLLLNLLELSLLLTGSLIEGLIIAFFLARNAGKETALIHAPT